MQMTEDRVEKEERGGLDPQISEEANILLVETRRVARKEISTRIR